MDAVNNKETGGRGQTKTIAPVVLSLIWLSLFAFAIVAAFEPAWFKELAKHGRTDESAAMKDYGDNFLRQKNYRMAITHYLKALEIKPDFEAALGNLAIAYNLSGRGDQGIKIMQDSLKKGSKRRGTLCIGIGDILTGQGKKEKAVDYFIGAIGTEVPQEIVYRKLGILYFDTNQLEKARGSFETALGIYNNPATPYLNMLRLNRVLITDDPKRVAEIEALLENYKGLPDLEQYDLKTIERINRTNVDIAKIHNYLGVIDAAMGDSLDAQEHFRQSLLIWPANIDADRNLKLLAKR